MPREVPPLDARALEEAVHRFRDHVGGIAARLEATLFARGAVSDLFQCEAAMAGAWPGRVDKEVVWSRQDLAGHDGLRLRAFDEEGRLIGEANTALGMLGRTGG